MYSYRLLLCLYVIIFCSIGRFYVSYYYFLFFYDAGVAGSHLVLSTKLRLNFLYVNTKIEITEVRTTMTLV